jgi:hypothetical protein
MTIFLYGSFKGSVLISALIASNEMVIDKDELGKCVRKWLWPDLKLYPRICLDGLGKLTKKPCRCCQSEGCDFNLWHFRNTFHQSCFSVGRASESYFEGVWFEFFPGIRIILTKFFVVFLNPHMKMAVMVFSIHAVH